MMPKVTAPLTPKTNRDMKITNAPRFSSFILLLRRISVWGKMQTKIVTNQIIIIIAPVIRKGELFNVYPRPEIAVAIRKISRAK